MHLHSLSIIIIRYVVLSELLPKYPVFLSNPCSICSLDGTIVSEMVHSQYLLNYTIFLSSTWSTSVQGIVTKGLHFRLERASPDLYDTIYCVNQVKRLIRWCKRERSKNFCAVSVNGQMQFPTWVANLWLLKEMLAKVLLMILTSGRELGIGASFHNQIF